MVTYADGYTAVANPDDLMCGCTKTSPTFDDAWLAKVVADTGDRYRLPGTEDCAYIDADGHCQPGSTLPVAVPKKHPVIPKHLVRGVNLA